MPTREALCKQLEGLAASLLAEPPPTVDPETTATVLGLLTLALNALDCCPDTAAPLCPPVGLRG